MKAWLRGACAAALLAALAAVAHSDEAAPPKPAQIDRNGLLILVKSTLIALDQANKSGNYTVLRDLGAPSFASANNASRLAEIFANLRRDKIDLSGVLVLEPQLTVLPEITANGMLHVAGFFPSAPTQLNFEFLYAPFEGRWRLFGIAAGIASTTPVAPTPPASPKPTASAPKATASAPKPTVSAPKPAATPTAKPKPKKEAEPENP